MSEGKLKNERYFPCPWCNKEIHYQHREKTIDPAIPATKETIIVVEKYAQTTLSTGKVKE